MNNNSVSSTTVYKHFEMVLGDKVSNEYHLNFVLIKVS